MATKKDAGGPISIQEMDSRSAEIWVLGRSPLICNSMSEKARHELLMPAKRSRSNAGRTGLKHDVLREYRDSPYVLEDEGAPTLLAVMASAFKGAMMTAALDTPGSSKAQIGRLVWVNGDYVPVYGTPQLFMSVTRSADIGRTPDVRTRAILPKWAALVSVSWVTPLLNEKSVLNLIQAGGLLAGIGDWRPEKGKGNYGQYTIVSRENADLKALLREERAVQKKAMQDPVPYDAESKKLLEWFQQEVVERGVEHEQYAGVAAHLPFLGEDDEEPETDDSSNIDA